MNTFQALWGLEGRIGRKHFWLAGIVWTIGWFMIYLAAIHLLSGGQWMSLNYVQTTEGARTTAIAMLIAYAIGFYPSLSMSVKRLHDLNLSGWLCVPLMAPSLVSVLLPIAGVAGSPEAPSMLAQITTAVSMVVGLAYLVLLGFIRGTTGPNRFGDNGFVAVPMAA